VTKKQGMPLIVHGAHAKKRNKTKCGIASNKFPDGNHKVVNTNAVNQITCQACLRANKPGEV
jgi:hypothetical protein